MMRQTLGLCVLEAIVLIPIACFSRDMRFSSWSRSCDWASLNAAARVQAKKPVRLGIPGKIPFWNGCSKAFIHPPAFDIPEEQGTKEYRFTLTDEQGRTSSWTADKPWRPIPGDIWDAKLPGSYTLKVGNFERKLYRAAVFKGPYPAATNDYATCARRVYSSIYNRPYVQGWLTSDDPPEGYDLYCYPSKILASVILALVRHAEFESQDASRAYAIACRMADWLIAHSQPADAPLAHFPPTYWGTRRKTAVQYAGQNMLLYPAQVAASFFGLADATGEKKYCQIAMDIARTYAKLQGEDGSWPLKVRERDGTPVRANRIVPDARIWEMLDRAEKIDPSFGKVRERAFRFLLDGPVKTWNWDGQFEDMNPLPPYQNLQKGVAIDTAVRLFAQGRDVKTACELVDWSEDQFAVWSDPIHHMDWQHWKTPTALEQYDYYTPIDASMADLIRGFASAYRATGDTLYLAKARALADNIVCHQRTDGTIPTYFDNRTGSDWLNCTIYVAQTLETLQALGDHRALHVFNRTRR